VITFGPEGAYGHTDHIAISQLTAAAIPSAADPSYDVPGEPAPRIEVLFHRVESPRKWGAYQAALKALVFKVDGQERRATPVAVVGAHDRRGHEPGVAYRVARGVVSQDADVDLRAARRAAGRAPSRALGHAGVLSRVQLRQRRARARNRSLRGDCDERPHARLEALAAAHGAAGDVGRASSATSATGSSISSPSGSRAIPSGR
jgi:LmbE family N-acetylglucosaminyl deacetylase